MTALRLTAALFLALATSGCGDPVEEKRRIDDALPHGCTFRDFGRYQGMSVVAVICVRQSSTTTSYTWKVGKTSSYAATVTIGDQP